MFSRKFLFYLISGLSVLAVFLSVFIPRALAADYGERIDSFVSNIAIHSDGLAVVTEKLNYNSGSITRHGIIRDIPFGSHNGPDLNLRVIGVTSDFGLKENYLTYLSGDNLEIKIGDPNITFNGPRSYQIVYEVRNAIRPFTDHDEFYWNVTGNDWDFPINSASAVISLPPELSGQNIKINCFTGVQGSSDKNCTTKNQGNIASVVASNVLDAGEGLTAAVSFPTGYISTNAIASNSGDYSGISVSAGQGWLFFIGIFALFGIIFVVAIIKQIVPALFYKKPKPVVPWALRGKPVVVEYTPPANLPPIEVGTILDRKVDLTDISSVIVDLAVKGYLKIKYINKEIPFWPDKKDYQLVKLKDGADLVHPAYQIIFDYLFSGRDEVTLSDLKNSSSYQSAKLKDLIKDTQDHLHDEGYLPMTSQSLNAIRVGMSIAIFFLLQLSLSFIAGPIFPLVIIIAVGSIGTVNRYFSSKLTPMGLDVLYKILGFRDFLRLTETDRLKLLNAPKLEPQIFEKFLPYAMVLGVENEWAKQFEGIYQGSPIWYEDTVNHNLAFNALILNNSLNSFGSSFNKSFSVPANKYGSGFGGGGFGGGGFSGGGSGGGGGHGW